MGLGETSYNDPFKHVEVANAAARNAYPVGLRKWGMRVTEEDTQLTYRLLQVDPSFGKDDNTNWIAERNDLIQFTTINSDDNIPTYDGDLYSTVTYIIFVDATAGNITLTLPAPHQNVIHKIKRIDNTGNLVLFDGEVDGVDPYLGGVGIPGLGSVTIISNGTALFALS